MRAALAIAATAWLVLATSTAIDARAETVTTAEASGTAPAEPEATPEPPIVLTCNRDAGLAPKVAF